MRDRAETRGVELARAGVESSESLCTLTSKYFQLQLQEFNDRGSGYRAAAEKNTQAEFKSQSNLEIDLIYSSTSYDRMY